MELMDDETKEQVRSAMDSMIDRVHAKVFTKEQECPACEDTVKIVDAISELGDKFTYVRMDLDENSTEAENMGVDKAPAIVMFKGGPDNNHSTGIRFFGIPSGFEFTSLLDSIMTISKGEEGISDEGKEFLGSLKTDIHMEVFVTPTCPYCPRAVVLAHHLAVLSDRVTSDMVEAQEFPELSQKYQVMGVPRTIINGKFHQEGAAPERMILELMRKAASAQ